MHKNSTISSTIFNLQVKGGRPDCDLNIPHMVPYLLHTHGVFLRKGYLIMELMYNLKQLNKIYGISERTWREYIKRKDLRAYKIGRSYLVSEDDVMTFFKGKEAYKWRKKGAYPFDG